MKATIEYIENWLKEYRPDILATLNQPASGKEIADLESHFDVDLPEDVKTFFLRYNGQDCSEVYDSPIIEPESEGLMSLEEIRTCSAQLKGINELYPMEIDEKNVDKAIKPVYWNDKWLPLISEGNGDYFLLDLDPTENGSVGQIIHRLHEGPRIEIVADDFKSWCQDFIKNCLE